MKTWIKPAATEMRFGFEVTMYVMNKQFCLGALSPLVIQPDGLGYTYQSIDV